MFKLIIAGGRNFNDTALMLKGIEAFKAKYHLDKITVISGVARGADQLGIQCAELLQLPTILMPADWDKYGKSAGYRRNADMANVADGCLAFWDGKSRGTMHMINIAKEKGLKTEWIKY